MKLDQVCLKIVLNSLLDIVENELEVIEILCSKGSKVSKGGKYLIRRHIALFDYLIKNYVSKIINGEDISIETHPKLYKEFRANRWKYRELNYEKLKNISISGYKYGSECAIASMHRFRIMGNVHKSILHRYRNLIHELVLTTSKIDMKFAYINANEYPLFRDAVRAYLNIKINKNRIRNRKKLNGRSPVISER